MIVTATQKQISVTPRKMRMMAHAIKNLKPLKAIEELGYLNQSAAKPLRKVLQQAMANATNNHKLSPDLLSIKEVVIGQGWTLKRWRPGARGRGKPYTRRRSHVTVKLEAREPKIIATPKTALPEKTATKKVVVKKSAAKKTSVKKTVTSKKSTTKKSK